MKTVDWKACLLVVCSVFESEEVMVDLKVVQMVVLEQRLVVKLAASMVYCLVAK